MKRNRHKIFSYPFERAKEDKGFLLHYLKGINNIKLKSGLFKYFPYKFLYKYIGNDVEYVFFGMNYIDLAKSLSLHKSIILTTLSDIDVVKKEKNLFIFPYNYIAYGVSKVFNTDPSLEKESSEKIINFTIEFFKKTHPKFLIVSNDSLFIERFLIYCAREAGIKTICIQHGIVQSVANPVILDGKYADLMYVWSEKQKNIFIDSGIAHSKVQVLGYPHKILTLKSYIRDYDKTKICIIGQPWENYDVKLGEKKKQIFNKIVSQFVGIDIVYKPHPSENDMNYFPENVRLFRGSLSEAIEKYDYFFSLTSTALLEVSLCDKIAIQIYDADFNCDIFEKVGWSYTCHLLKNTNFRQYIDWIDESFPIGEDALFLPENIGQRFLDLEKAIEEESV